MLQRLEQAQESWGGSDKSIDKWLSDREHVLVKYCKLAGLKPYQQEPQLPSSEELKDFCISLMDYTSAGHFEVYDKLISPINGGGCTLATKLYPQINQTTDVVLSFNDCYGDGPASEQALENLDQDLCTLGEALSQRFELEDKLITNLFESRAISA